jgi:alanine racemase
LAAAAGTIGYEVLTSLGGRYHRIYRQESLPY